MRTGGTNPLDQHPKQMSSQVKPFLWAKDMEKVKRARRKPKRGYVYILTNQDGSIFKYGASIDPVARAKHISNCCPIHIFTVVKKYLTMDMFKEENKLRWALMRAFICMGTEFVYQDLMALSELIALTERTIEVV